MLSSTTPFKIHDENSYTQSSHIKSSAAGKSLSNTNHFPSKPSTKSVAFSLEISDSTPLKSAIPYPRSSSKGDKSQTRRALGDLSSSHLNTRGGLTPGVIKEKQVISSGSKFVESSSHKGLERQSKHSSIKIFDVSPKENAAKTENIQRTKVPTSITNSINNTKQLVADPQLKENLVFDDADMICSRREKASEDPFDEILRNRNFLRHKVFDTDYDDNFFDIIAQSPVLDKNLIYPYMDDIKFVIEDEDSIIQPPEEIYEELPVFTLE